MQLFPSPKSRIKQEPFVVIYNQQKCPHLHIKAQKLWKLDLW